MPNISITGPVRGVYNAKAFSTVANKLNDGNKVVGFVFLGDSNALYGTGSQRKQGFAGALCTALDRMGYRQFATSIYGMIMNAGFGSNFMYNGTNSPSSSDPVYLFVSGTGDSVAAGFTGNTASRRSPVDEMYAEIQPYCLTAVQDSLHEGVWYREDRRWWARYRMGVEVLPAGMNGLHNSHITVQNGWRHAVWHMKGPSAGNIGFFARNNEGTPTVGSLGVPSNFTQLGYETYISPGGASAASNAHFIGYTVRSVTSQVIAGTFSAVSENQPFNGNNYSSATTLTGPQAYIHQAVIAATGYSGGYFGTTLLYQSGKHLGIFNDRLNGPKGATSFGKPWLESYIQACIDVIGMNATAGAVPATNGGNTAGALCFVINCGRNDVNATTATETGGGSYNYITLQYEASAIGASGPSGYYRNMRTIVNRLLGLTAVKNFNDGTNVKFILMPSHYMSPAMMGAGAGPIMTAKGLTSDGTSVTKLQGYNDVIKQLVLEDPNSVYGQHCVYADITELVSPEELAAGLDSQDHFHRSGYNLIMQRLFRRLLLQAPQYTGLENAGWGSVVSFEGIPNFLTPQDRDSVIATDRGWEIPLAGITGITNPNDAYEVLVPMRGLASRSLTADRRGPIIETMFIDSSSDGFTATNNAVYRSGLVSANNQYRTLVRLSPGEEVKTYSSYGWSAAGATCSLTFGATYPSWLKIEAGPTFNTFMLTGPSASYHGLSGGVRQQVDLVASSPQGLTSGYTFIMRVGW